METRKTTKLERDAFEYLNNLRETGATNMFGAGPYLSEEFGVDKRVARTLMQMWMASFNNEGEYEEISKKYEEVK